MTGDKKLYVHLTQNHSPKITGKSIRQIRDAMLINNEQPNARIQRPMKKLHKMRRQKFDHHWKNKEVLLDTTTIHNRQEWHLNQRTR